MLIAVVLIVAAPVAALADSVLLVQGYHGSAYSWRGSGITIGLQRAGWADGGHLTMGPGGVIGPRWNRRTRGARRFYTLDLPTEAPLIVQSDIIAAYVRMARRRHKGERVILVGHSAGGVAARLAMVRYPGLNVYGLVTIASPHLGAALADLGSAVANSPLSWFAPFFGANAINRSRALYHDLGRERPNNILGWLNRTPHPQAHYVSVVLTKGAPGRGDDVVVGWRQDMNMVPALRGRARTFYSLGNHGLRPSDGLLLARILAAMPR